MATGIFNFHHASTLRDGRVTYDNSKNLYDSSGDFTLTYTDFVKELIIVEAETTVRVYNYTNDGAFSMLELRCPDSGGYFNCWAYVDEITSVSNFDPKGTAASRGWRSQPDISCMCPRLFDSWNMPINPTTNTDIGDTNGLPTAASSGSTVTGRVYGVAVKNPTDEDLMLWVVRIGKAAE